uniref:Ribonuclease H-like domain, reverse transcriptase, RNA-dependent DNA polymerase n=1 Tax=Tanacetum cinerariifolium TaxID=118510 RepID=A0A6L2MC99_TANCI|nr:ribonuclease H-like domain, reverse transcriptase, RNA-dependent DNA polymerase [Tanacetum cinerariifolium]
MATSNEAAKKDDAIPDNNSPQKEQQEVNRDKEVPKSSQNSNPTTSSKVSTNDSFELASSSTVETEVPTVSSHVPPDSLSVPPNRLEDFFRDTSNAVSLNEVEADLSNIETAIQVSLTPTLKIHKDHPKKPKKIVDALKDPSWVEAMQQELLQGICDATPGFQDPEFPHRVYKVEKAMYGLHQAPRAWYGTLSKYLLDNGFQRDDNVADLLIKAFDVGRFQYLVVSIGMLNPSNVYLLLFVKFRIGFALLLDHNYGGANQDRKSTTGGCQFLGRRLISWQCKKQTIVATSTTEAEYVAAASSCGQVLLIQNQFLDYGNIATALVCLATNRTSNFFKMIFDGMMRNVKNKGSDSTDGMPHVLGSLGAVNILASGGLRSSFTTASLSVATASTCISPAVAIASGSFPTAVIFTTTSVATPTTRVTRSSRGVVIGSSSLISVNIPSISKKDKGKGKMIEPEEPSKKKVIEQIKLDRSNEMIAKYLSEYKQVVVGLLHDEKVELINELLKYQRHLAQIKKYQAQQNKLATKTERRNFYMSILRSNAGWKAKDFKGITFEQIEENSF